MAKMITYTIFPNISAVMVFVCDRVTSQHKLTFCLKGAIIFTVFK